MKNVLLVGEAYSGGVKTYIDSIIMNQKEFPDVNFKVLVSSKRKDKGIKINADFYVDDNLSFSKSPIKILKSLVFMHKVIQRDKINVIHANSTFPGILIFLYSFCNKNISFVYTPHGYYSLKNMSKIKKKIVRYVERKINDISKIVIHVSKSEEKEAIENNLVLKEKSFVIYNGVKDPERTDIKKTTSFFTVVNLARLDDQKNPFKFIEIAKKVVEVNPTIQFIWAGTGQFLEEVKKSVEEHNLKENVKFIGFTENKDEILKNADLYLSTSYYEGLPFAVVEAMSYKLPLVLSDIVGHNDLVEQEKNGILFMLNDIQLVSNFIESVSKDRDKLKRLSNSSYELYKKEFSIELMMKKLYENYQNLK